MPEIPDVSAIAQHVKARIEHIEDQLKQHHVLTDELDRLRAALVGLEGQARSRVKSGRRNRKPAPAPTRSAARERAAKPARAPGGQNKTNVLDALEAGPMTASEIAKVTGIATATVSTMLTRWPRLASWPKPSAATSSRNRPAPMATVSRPLVVDAAVLESPSVQEHGSRRVFGPLCRIPPG
jgi:hypothetical protein